MTRPRPSHLSVAIAVLSAVVATAGVYLIHTCHAIVTGAAVVLDTISRSL